MMPLLLQLADELEGKVHFVKMNCNAYNKDLGISLGVKVAPTFFLYKNSTKVGPIFKHGNKAKHTC
jgi:thioredoxin 1